MFHSCCQELGCTLSLLRHLLEDCSVAPVAATVLSLALAALWLLVPDCLRQLLLLHGRRLLLRLPGGPKFTAPQHLCRCHGVVRLPEQRAQLPCGTLAFYSHRHQVANTTRSRSIARAHIVMWTTSECAGVLVRCVIKPCCTLESLSLHHCASPPTRPIVLLRVRVQLTRAPTPSTSPTTPLLPPTCALPHCRYRCVASAATRSGAQCRCHSAAAVSLCRCLPFSADPSAAPCTPWIVLHLLPDLFVRGRASTNVMATLRWTLRDSHTSRLVQSSRREGSAVLSKFDFLVVFLHLHWCSYDACQFVNLAQRVPFRQMSRQVPFSGNSLCKYSS